MTATYIVNADANDLIGWTSAELVEALRGPLGKLGVAVEHRPNERGGESLRGVKDDGERQDIEAVVSRIITG